MKLNRTFTINIIHKDNLLIKLTVVLSACFITSVTYELKFIAISQKEKKNKIRIAKLPHVPSEC